MDLEDNETAINSFNSQVEELKGARDTLVSQLAQKQVQMSDMEAKLEESKAQVTLLVLKMHCQLNESSIDFKRCGRVSWLIALDWRKESKYNYFSVAFVHRSRC